MTFEFVCRMGSLAGNLSRAGRPNRRSDCHGITVIAVFFRVAEIVAGLARVQFFDSSEVLPLQLQFNVMIY